MGLAKEGDKKGGDGGARDLLRNLFRTRSPPSFFSSVCLKENKSQLETRGRGRGEVVQGREKVVTRNLNCYMKGKRERKKEKGRGPLLPSSTVLVCSVYAWEGQGIMSPSGSLFSLWLSFLHRVLAARPPYRLYWPADEMKRCSALPFPFLSLHLLSKRNLFPFLLCPWLFCRWRSQRRTKQEKGLSEEVTCVLTVLRTAK